jgi:hypothetical protein
MGVFADLALVAVAFLVELPDVEDVPLLQFLMQPLQVLGVLLLLGGGKFEPINLLLVLLVDFDEFYKIQLSIFLLLGVGLGLPATAFCLALEAAALDLKLLFFDKRTNKSFEITVTLCLLLLAVPDQSEDELLVVEVDLLELLLPLMLRLPSQDVLIELSELLTHSGEALALSLREVDSIVLQELVYLGQRLAVILTLHEKVVFDSEGRRCF